MEAYPPSGFDGQSKRALSEARVVVIGGGTGPSSFLETLKWYFPNITAIISTLDDGGSAGRLRKQRGYPAMGDIRKCLAALMTDREQAEALEVRQPNGDAAGNLMLCDLADTLGGDFEAAIAAAGKKLNIIGQVIPATIAPDARLMLHYTHPENGRPYVMPGEHRIDVFDVPDPRAYVSIAPEASLTTSAAGAIEYADLLLVAPGSEHASLGAALAAKGMARAIGNSRAPLVSAVNLGAEKHRSHVAHVTEHVSGLQRYTGRAVDVALYNSRPDLVPVPYRPLRIEGQPFSGPTRWIGRNLVGRCVETTRAHDALAGQRQGLRANVDTVAQLLIQEVLGA